MTNVLAGDVGSIWIVLAQCCRPFSLVCKSTKKNNNPLSRGNISQNICSFTKNMNMIRTLILLLLFPLAVVAQPAQALKKELGNLLNDKLFDTGDVSLMVYDLTVDTMLYSYRAQKLVRPASVQKVFIHSIPSSLIRLPMIRTTCLSRVAWILFSMMSMCKGWQTVLGPVWLSIHCSPIALSPIPSTGAVVGCGMTTLTAISLISHR